MRPTVSNMLQQNNNNNYPCLDVPGSTREMLHKCSRASLPFPSRLELGDLPLIRGLRAWALCSKNRRKAGGPLGAVQAPMTPPASRGTSCPRPADVCLIGEWGRMGYGLPLGVDARQAGIGALVTVATLKTSEGNGKTQTQCLFLRTEKGSCLYSTAKPGSGLTTSAASSVAGGWLRGKTGGGSGPDLQAQTGANRVRARSGRRWRKSGNAAGREKAGVSRERQRGRGEDPAEERQEEGDKGGLDSKQPPSLQQDDRRARQERESRSPRCCHSDSPKTQCGRRAQRREGQEEHEDRGGGVPTSDMKGMKKEWQRNEGEYFKSILPVPNPNLESKEEREAANNEEPGRRTTQSSEKENSGIIDTGSFPRSLPESPCTESVVNGFSDHDQESDAELESVYGEEEEGSVSPSESSVASSVLEQRVTRSSSPVEGSTCGDKHESCIHLEGNGGAGHAGEDEANCDQSNQEDERGASPPGLRHRAPERGGGATSDNVDKSEHDLNNAETREELEETGGDLDGVDGKGGDGGAAAVEEDRCGLTATRRPQESGCSIKDCGDTCDEKSVNRVAGANVTNVACANPSTSLALSLANPAPSLPSLGTMETSLPCVEAEEGRIRDEGGREGARRHGGELETQGQEGRKEEEGEDEFGVFIQAEGEPAWSEGFTMSASVPCGSRGSVALGNHGVAGESTNWTPSWTESSFHQSDDTWAAFPQDLSDEGRDSAGQWWPAGAEEERRDSEKQPLATLFVEAFPSLPPSSSADPSPDVPTLTQLLRGGAGQDQGLLASFHDLNKMIGQRYKRASGVSRSLLLRTLRVEQPHAESRAVPWSANRRLSPGLPSANQHAHNAAAKRRLSYDSNRNMMD